MESFSFCQSGEVTETPPKEIAMNHRRLGSYATYTPKKFQSSLTKSLTPNRKYLTKIHSPAEPVSAKAENEQLRSENLSLKQEVVDLRSSMVKLKAKLKEQRTLLHKKDDIVNRLSQLMNSREAEFKTVLESEVAKATSEQTHQVQRLRTELNKLNSIYTKQVTSLNQQVDAQQSIIEEFKELVGNHRAPRKEEPTAGNTDKLLGQSFTLAHMAKKDIRQVREIVSSLQQAVTPTLEKKVSPPHKSMRGLVTYLESLRDESTHLKSEVMAIAAENCSKECSVI